MNRDIEEIKTLVQDAIEELGFVEKSHPQLLPGEVLIGEIQFTADPSGKEHESYSSANLLEDVQYLKTARIGEKVFHESRALYDYSRPIFAEKDEWYSYLIANTPST